ncbi:DNA-binding protein [Streptomyces sp. NPDC047315]|uniref:DNA-binding protein n=1 Tax=Streptomyces sp. NPDC047315 TaxID=3155142 RepID=UPI0033F3DA01
MMYRSVSPTPDQERESPMIPQGRPVRTEAEIAAAAGLPLHTWRRRERDAFEQRVTRVNPAEGRVRLYDAAQADAYTNGQPIPPEPDLDAEHPDDLLTDKEAAAMLGIEASTVRAYSTSGYLSGAVDEHGRRWPRRAVVERIEQGDQREHPEKTGAGRPRNSPAGPNRGRAGRDPNTPIDPRVAQAADALARAKANGTKAPTATQIAELHGVSRTTGAAILRTARTLNETEQQN